METFRIEGRDGACRLLVGESLDRLDRYLPAAGTVIVTDGPVAHLYGSRFPAVPVITIGTGEASKTLETVRSIYERLLALQADRSTFVAAVGGGIVCDVAGFAASTFMRGVRFGFVATTLLAQVDASVGGKNGVNLGGFKNMVGVFNQPEFVICDPLLLTSLSPRDVRCGMGEIVKHAAIADADMFGFLEDNGADALALAPAVIQRLVHDSIRIKSAVVGRDEREQGERRMLNFGHTIGHALEKLGGLAHGEAVAAGMAAAARISVQKGFLDPAALARIEALLAGLDLPVRTGADPDAVLAAMARDKKREGAVYHFVLLRAIGHGVVEPLAAAELAALLHRIEL